MRKVVEYEIEDIGVDNCQFFPGRGTTFTKWDDVSVGIGENAKEALDDALDNLSQSGWDTGAVPNNLPETPGVGEILGEEPGDDLYYHVAVYVKGNP